MIDESMKFGRGLSGLQGIDPARRQEYDDALQRIFQAKLSAWGRLRYLLPSMCGLLMALGMSTLALTEPSSTPLGTRLLLLGIALMGAAWFVICGRILLKGSIDLVADKRLVSGVALVFTALQALAFAWFTWSDASLLPGLILSVVFVLLAGVVFITQEIRSSELRLREHQLRALLAGR